MWSSICTVDSAVGTVVEMLACLFTDSGRGRMVQTSSSSDTGADSIPSNIAPRVNKRIYRESRAANEEQ